jgi:hypothetical protein
MRTTGHLLGSRARCVDHVRVCEGKLGRRLPGIWWNRVSTAVYAIGVAPSWVYGSSETGFRLLIDMIRTAPFHSLRDSS